MHGFSCINIIWKKPKNFFHVTRDSQKAGFLTKKKKKKYFFALAAKFKHIFFLN